MIEQIMTVFFVGILVGSLIVMLPAFVLAAVAMTKDLIKYG